jgi:hypothetical protein
LYKVKRQGDIFNNNPPPKTPFIYPFSTTPTSYISEFSSETLSAPIPALPVSLLHLAIRLGM